MWSPGSFKIEAVQGTDALANPLGNGVRFADWVRFVIRGYPHAHRSVRFAKPRPASNSRKWIGHRARETQRLTEHEEIDAEIVKAKTKQI
jgi:hypothetical protein